MAMASAGCRVSNINFERKDLNFPQKIHRPPDDLGEICFFLYFYLRIQHVTDFSFISLTQNFVYTFKLLLPGTVSPHRINGSLSGNSSSSVTLVSASSPHWYLTPPNSHIQKQVILERINIKMLFVEK